MSPGFDARFNAINCRRSRLTCFGWTPLALPVRKNVSIPLCQNDRIIYGMYRETYHDATIDNLFRVEAPRVIARSRRRRGNLRPGRTDKQIATLRSQ